MYKKIELSQAQGRLEFQIIEPVQVKLLTQSVVSQDVFRVDDLGSNP